MFVKSKEKKAEKPKESLSESIAGIAAVLVSGLFIITFIVQAFEIPSESMVETLLVGDHVFVDRLSPTAKAGFVGPLIPYREIRHGDIIVFLHPKEPGMYVVKRIIGVPGDRIHLHEGKVYRNGEELNEPYVIHSSRGLQSLSRRVSFRSQAGPGNTGVARGNARAPEQRRRTGSPAR